MSDRNELTDEYYTPEEVAGIIKVKKQTLAEWRMGRGSVEIPYIKLGRKILYRRQDLEKYLEENLHTFTLEYS